MPKIRTPSEPHRSHIAVADTAPLPADWTVRRTSPRARITQWARRVARGSPRSFLVAVGVVFATGVLGMLALSVYVNPRGNFGRVRYQFLYNVRQAKVDYLDQCPRHELPEVLVLGSSNTMQYSPASITRRLGLSAFNFGVFWGKAEDLLCIVSHVVKDLNHRPELLLIGVDTWTFAPDGDERPGTQRFQRRLLNTPQLIRHHPDANSLSIGWAKTIDAFSSKYLRLSYHLLRTDPKGRSAPLPLDQQGGFRTDGTRIRYGNIFGDVKTNIFEDVEAGRFPITKTLSRMVDQGRCDELAWAIGEYDFDGLGPARTEYMEQLLALCQKEGIQVAFIISPIHPLFLQVLEDRTPHRRNLEQLHQLLKRFKNEFPVVRATLDASRIASFGGDPDGFFDPLHPATRNCDRILDRVAALLGS